MNYQIVYPVVCFKVRTICPFKYLYLVLETRLIMQMRPTNLQDFQFQTLRQVLNSDLIGLFSYL